MPSIGKDAAATIVTAFAVLTFAATHESWNVWLVGSSHRWAAGAILLLGAVGCGLGERRPGRAAGISATLGIVAAGLGVAAIVTGSLTLVSVLVLDVVVLWALATTRHATRRHTTLAH